VKPEKSEEDVLKGTTLRVYRLIYRQGRPMGVHDVQRGLQLSSPSVAQYHIKKLLESETDPPTRAMLLCFLAEEVAKQQEYLVRHARPLCGIVQ